MKRRWSGNIISLCSRDAMHALLATIVSHNLADIFRFSHSEAKSEEGGRK